METLRYSVGFGLWGATILSSAMFAQVALNEDLHPTLREQAAHMTNMCSIVGWIYVLFIER